MEEITGHVVKWDNVIEVELAKRKRTWLSAFSKPKRLLKDVTELHNDSAFNYMTEEDETLPCEGDVFLYSYGFSCKDLSTLNNHSGHFKASCIESGTGSTGATWVGNLGFVAKTRPPMLLIENVPAALKGRNNEQIQADLRAQGYIVFQHLLSSVECGVPQDRRRAWFCALRQDYAPQNWLDVYDDAVQSLKLPTVMKLSRFLLPDDHEYVQAVLASKKAKQLKAAQRVGRSRRGSRSAKAKLQRRSGKQWLVDHWKLRCKHDMPVATPVTEPPELAAIAVENGMCPRERVFMRLYIDFPLPDNTVRPNVVELKHSAPRVIRGHKHRKPEDVSSTILPASKIFLFPPVTRSPRLFAHVLSNCLLSISCA